MPGVSREQIARAKEIRIEDYVLSHEPSNVKRIGRALYLKDHDSLEISNGLWNWHSRDIGGKNVIDYLIKVRGYGFVDAVRHLAGDEIPSSRTVTPNARPPTSPPQTALSSEPLDGDSMNAPSRVIATRGSPAAERETFKLPRRFENNNRVIEYLQGRGITEKLIQECIRQNVLYESADFHNAVFVGRDERGKARFAAMRGTRGNFKQDADGSDKRYGFCLPPASPNSDAVAVFESPIDALSHKTLEPRFDGYRLSLGGTAIAALTQFLKTHPKIKNVTVCTDNDEAGSAVARKIEELTDCRVTRSLPPAGKDWNEALQLNGNEVNPLEDMRKDIRFINSGYDTLFTVKDGESVKFTNGFGGDEQNMKCRFIDKLHVTLIGKFHNDYHICELAELIERNGSRFEPVTNQKAMIDVLSAPYGGVLQDIAIPMTEAAVRKLVGGKYEAEPLYGASGKEVFGILLRGRDGIAVCGAGGDEKNIPTSLHPYWAQKFKRELSPAERPFPEKSDFLGKIDKFKEKASAQVKTPVTPDKSKNGTSL